MVPLVSLWFPILLAVVVVFIVSSLLHMVLPYHRADYRRLPAEDATMDALRGIPPGEYLMPCPAGPAALRDPAFVEKKNRGPVAILRVAQPGGPPMARNLAMWALYSLVVTLFAAYITSRALPPGSPYHQVFRFAGATAFAGYALALMHDSIWNLRRWKTTLVYMADGLVYALFTAGVLGWLWPRCC